MKLRSVTPAPRPPQHWKVMLPCPFCDGEAKMLSSAMLSVPNVGSNACVICSRCGSGGPVVEPVNEYRTLEAIERHAVRLWNRRGSHQAAEWKLRRIAQILNSEHAG